MFRFTLTTTLVLLLSGCFFVREWIKRPPDQIEVPAGSSQAICEQDNVSYTYVYQLDGIYLYYIDDILQDEEALNHELEQAYLHGESVENYLNAEYGLSNCVITDYEAPNEDE
jgi:hypothetical protein